MTIPDYARQAERLADRQRASSHRLRNWTFTLIAFYIAAHVVVACWAGRL